MTLICVVLESMTFAGTGGAITGQTVRRLLAASVRQENGRELRALVVDYECGWVLGLHVCFSSLVVDDG
ncbi:hypothetical protein DAT35_27640 [Vitiosangium sp. GDMCC 1.1324]|nr:hypothetical protein DAT35_27640 [Vitiosangium sp. GDMCC 1.1324]